MTVLGKTLVLVTVALSLAFLGYALVVFAFPIDWGWDPKNAPKEGGQPVKSRLTAADERIKQLGLARENAEADWADADGRLKHVEADIAAREYQYSLILARVQSGPENLEIKDLQKNAAGDYVPDPDTGLPSFADKVADKTYEGYVKELTRVLERINRVQKDIQELVTKEKHLGEVLNGKTDALGKKIGKGLYDLVAHEVAVRKQAEAEMEDLQPRYYQELVDAQLFLDRQKQLLGRIRELENLGPTK
jgi:hypothetical protein